MLPPFWKIYLLSNSSKLYPKLFCGWEWVWLFCVRSENQVVVSCQVPLSVVHLSWVSRSKSTLSWCTDTPRTSSFFASGSRLTLLFIQDTHSWTSRCLCWLSISKGALFCNQDCYHESVAVQPRHAHWPYPFIFPPLSVMAKRAIRV